jgi:hypothetical protein
MIGGGPSLRYLIAAAADDEEDDDDDEEEDDGGGAMNTPRLSAFGSGYVDAGTNSNRLVMAFSLGRYSTIELIVGEDAIGEPADGGAAEVASHPEVASDSDRRKERAPLLWVRGERWSPGVYRSLRLLGRPLEVAWERAFIALPTF